VLVIGALSALGWWRAIGFKRPAQPRHLFSFMILLLPVLINLGVGLNVPSPTLFMELLASAFLIGFAEEAIFRMWYGLYIMRQKGAEPMIHADERVVR